MIQIGGGTCDCAKFIALGFGFGTEIGSRETEGLDNILV